MTKDVSKLELYRGPKRKAQFTDEEKAKAARHLAHARGVRADRKQRYAVKEGRLTESRLQLAVVAASRRLGFLTVKLRASGRRGVPDLLMIAPGGRVFFMEVKVKGGRLSPLQDRFINDLMQHGATVHVCWSLPEAIEIMQGELRHG